MGPLEYKLVSGYFYGEELGYDKFEAKITELLNDGWQFAGPATVISSDSNGSILGQPMIRMKEVVIN